MSDMADNETDHVPDETPDVQRALRQLPAVDHLLKHHSVAGLLDDYPRGELVYVVRTILAERRAALQAGERADCEISTLALEIRQRLYERSQPSLRKVINATGIVLHTGLGRAPLAEEALEALANVAGGYSNLELDLDTGRRGNRHAHLRNLLRELCGAEDAIVVNNNAAATFLVLNTFAAEREAIVSRGQLVEIGGSYRLPDIMGAARCRMVEVGTTNRTRISDYQRAISDETAVLLRVHTSNYRVVGFTEQTPLEELVDLARRHNLVVADDLGSGLLMHDLPWPEEEENEETGELEGSPGPEDWDEPGVRESLAAGADVALFSGDKLLGGPQAGIIVGRAPLIEALRKNPLARAFRPGKLTLAALEATMRLYRDPDAVLERLPTYRLLSRTPSELRAAAETLAEQIRSALPEAGVEVEPDESEAGGGSLATVPFPTWVVSVQLDGVSAEVLSAALRAREVPIIARIYDEALLFDLRTLEEDDADQIAPALCEALREL